MANIVEFEVFRDYLGVAPASVDEDEVSLLYDAIGAEIRRLTRRAFEGDEGGDYDQVIRIDGAREFRLPHVPVEAVTSIRRVWFDGTEEGVYATTEWRLENAATGLISIRPGAGRWATRAWPARARGPEYVRVIWKTTGAIPAQLPWAYLEWGKDRWDDKARPAGLASYATGGDSESYFAALAGRPPRQVLGAILGAQHTTSGGRV